MTDQMHFVSALTTAWDVNDAVRELVTLIDAQVGEGPLDLLLAFLSPHFVPVASQLSQRLRAALKPGLFLGCTGEGVIGSKREVERAPAISLVAARLPGVELAPFALAPQEWPTTLQDPSALSRALAAPGQPKLFLVLADPFSTPMDEVLEAFNSFYAGVPVVGGMASSAGRPGGNALLLNDALITSGAVGVAWSGAFKLDVIVSQGCRPVGHPLTVTSAARNVILGLEGQPPLIHVHDLIERLSEHDRALLQTNGLFVGRAIDRQQEALGRGDFLIRSVLGIDQANGALVIGDYVQASETIQFHLRDATTAKEDLEMLLLPQAFFDAPRGGLLFSCNGRGTRLYDHPDGDVSTVQSVLGAVHLAGFFCAGEIGPIGGKSFLHGHTVSLALFRPLTPQNQTT